MLATYGWTVSDPNPSDILRCRVDVDSDGTFDHEVVPCRNIDTVLSQFDTAGTRTATLEVDDGVFPPVTATADVDVTAGPGETYEITLRLDPGMRPEFRDAFQAAADRWAEAIVAGVPDRFLDLPLGLLGFPAFTGTVDDVLIDARDVAIDGEGSVLGRAGGFIVREGHWQPYYGIMEFDTADLEWMLANGRLHHVILHEMGHVLGLGGNWLLTGHVTDFPLDPKYNGRAGVAAHQELGGTRYPPLENEGGLGTVFGHWRESVFGNELMTGYSNPGLQPMSRMTIAALADHGYGVDLGAADPYTIPNPQVVANAAPDPMAGLHTLPITAESAGYAPN